MAQPKLVHIAIILLISGFFVCDVAWGAPSLRATYSTRSRDLAVVVRRVSPLTSSCRVDLFAALAPGQITQRGRLIASAVPDSDVVKFRARAVPLLKGSSATRRVYLGASLTCADGAPSRTPVIGVSITQGVRGQPASTWFIQVARKFAAIVVKLNPAFKGLTFDSPLDLQPTRDGSADTLVVEQGGRVWRVSNSGGTASKSLALDLTSLTASDGERGLLGLAVHPNFGVNGFVYVNFTERDTGNTRISRFALVKGQTISAAAEVRILAVNQPFPNHNGGGLAFGPDGFLYIGLGDGGSGGDPQGNGQSRTTLLGKMLRIDVNRSDGDLNYAIPQSNPFVGLGNPAIKEEIFAYGFRNPFRFSFDAKEGGLWVGDVGQNRIEEVDVVSSGGNYGWNSMEGSDCYQPSSGCDRTGLSLPVTEYSHDEGQSITGGFVYRGTMIPALTGRYIFGDFVSGKIWSFDRTSRRRELLLATGLNISSFGQDEDGELYVVSYGDGSIRSLRR